MVEKKSKHNFIKIVMVIKKIRSDKGHSWVKKAFIR